MPIMQHENAFATYEELLQISGCGADICFNDHLREKLSLPDQEEGEVEAGILRTITYAQLMKETVEGIAGKFSSWEEEEEEVRKALLSFFDRRTSGLGKSQRRTLMVSLAAQAMEMAGEAPDRGEILRLARMNEAALREVFSTALLRAAHGKIRELDLETLSPGEVPEGLPFQMEACAMSAFVNNPSFFACPQAVGLVSGAVAGYAQRENGDTLEMAGLLGVVLLVFSAGIILTILMGALLGAGVGSLAIFFGEEVTAKLTFGEFFVSLLREFALEIKIAGGAGAVGALMLAASELAKRVPRQQVLSGIELRMEESVPREESEEGETYEEERVALEKKVTLVDAEVS